MYVQGAPASFTIRYRHRMSELIWTVVSIDMSVSDCSQALVLPNQESKGPNKNCASGYLSKHVDL